jgi:hypothetical protein
MEHEHGAFKVNLKTFPCHPLARLKKGAKNLRFAAGSTAVRTLQRKKFICRKFRQPGSFAQKLSRLPNKHTFFSSR